MKYKNPNTFTEEEEKEVISILRVAGCKCPLPLFGYIPNAGWRCRLCNTVEKPNWKMLDNNNVS